MQPPLPTPDELLRTALGTEPTTHPAPADLAPHLPDLEIEALIGQGGMGAVYRVRRRADGKVLALKVVWPEAGKEAAFAARFAREAEALERLRHPNIVAIHGHGAAGPWCWLLMDLVEGANLREIVATGRLSPAQTLALVPPLCAALQYAHDQGVVHHDLKPENILLDAAGVPHLVDFGLAKLRDGTAGSDLTNTGAGMGTVHYMAPEQVASAKDVDHRADIYALGVVLYELLTGELPLGRFENPSQRAAVDARIDAVVLKALERDRERRWQEMRQVGQAVEDGMTTPSADPALFWLPVISVLCWLGALAMQFSGEPNQARTAGITVLVVFGLAGVASSIVLRRRSPRRYATRSDKARGRNPPSGSNWALPPGTLTICVLALAVVLLPLWQPLKILIGSAIGVALLVHLYAHLIRQGRTRMLWVTCGVALGLVAAGMGILGREVRLQDWTSSEPVPVREEEKGATSQDWLSCAPGLPQAEVAAFHSRLRAVELTCGFRVPNAPVMRIVEPLCAQAGFACAAVGDLTGHALPPLELEMQPLEDILRVISAQAAVRFLWTGSVLQVMPVGAPRP